MDAKTTSQCLRVALYARVSTKDKGQDPANQLDQLRDFAAAQKWEIVGEYVDRMTAKHADRPAFKRLFADASKRRFDAVLFWSLDRFSREGVRETLNHLTVLDSYGVAWRSLTEQYLDSTGFFKDAVISILATIAKQERIRLSERTIAGLRRAKREGRVGGRPKIVCDRQKAKDMHAAGSSFAQIAEALGVSRTTAKRITDAA